MAPGEVDRIEILVQNTTVRGPTVFSAVCYDQNGNVVDAIISWTTTDPAGRITSDGLYTPGDSGTWTVTTSHRRLTAYTTVVVESAEEIPSSMNLASPPVLFLFLLLVLIVLVIVRGLLGRKGES